MASAAVKAAVEARLAGWSNLTSCPLAPINDTATSPQRHFLEIEYPIATETREELGPRPALYKEEGVISFIINERSLDGIATALGWTEELRDLFRDTEFGGIVTYEASPATFDKRNFDGVFYRVPFEVPYHYFYSK